jgi:hypothetical protein
MIRMSLFVTGAPMTRTATTAVLLPDFVNSFALDMCAVIWKEIRNGYATVLSTMSSVE